MMSRFQNCHCIGSPIGKTWETSCCKLNCGYCIFANIWPQFVLLKRQLLQLLSWHNEEQLSEEVCCYLISLFPEAWILCWYQRWCHYRSCQQRSAWNCDTYHHHIHRCEIDTKEINKMLSCFHNLTPAYFIQVYVTRNLLVVQVYLVGKLVWCKN